MSLIVRRFVTFLAVLGVSAAAACKPPDENGGKPPVKEAAPPTEKRKIAPPRPIADERVIRALEAEVASLKRQVAEGKPAVAYFGTINAHEHLYKLKDLERYLPAARDPPEVASPVGFNFVVVIANPHPSLLARRARRVPRSVAGFDPSHPVGPTLLWSVQEPDA